MPDTTAPKANPLGALLQAGSVTFVVALGFLARTAFYEGFSAALGIDTGINLAPPVSVTSATFAIVSVIGTMNMIYAWIRSKREVTVGSLAYDSSMLVTVGFFVEGVLAVFALHRWWAYASWTILALAGCGAWIYPIFAVKERVGYREKLKLLNARKDPPQAEGQVQIYEIVTAIGGPFLTTLFLTALLVVPVGYYFGRKMASEKTEWSVAETTETLASSSLTRWVVVSRAEDRLWVLAVSPERKVLGKLRVFALDSPGLFVSTQRLGKLELPADSK